MDQSTILQPALAPQSASAAQWEIGNESHLVGDDLLLATSNDQSVNAYYAYYGFSASNGNDEYRFGFGDGQDRIVVRMLLGDGLRFKRQGVPLGQ